MLDGKTMNTQCSIYYLHKYIDKLIEDGSRIICIFANNVKSNKPLDSNVEEKNKYYNSRYNNYYRQYKSNKIDEDMFNRIKIKLKELKENCNDKKEFFDEFTIFEKEIIKKGQIRLKKSVDENIVEIFDNMINKTNKREILIMIKSDILEFCGEISPIELEFLSENIYDYCCLMVNQITDTKIMWYITRKNAKYYDQVSEGDREKFCFKFDLKQMQELIKNI